MKPTRLIKWGVNQLTAMNEHTQGKVAAQMYLGSELLVVELRQPRIIEARKGIDYKDVDRTIDIFDLMDAHQQGKPL